MRTVRLLQKQLSSRQPPRSVPSVRRWWSWVRAPPDACPAPWPRPQSPKPQARLYSQDLKQIDLGGNRAFRNRIMFRERYGIKWVPGAPRGEAWAWV